MSVGKLVLSLVKVLTGDRGCWLLCVFQLVGCVSVKLSALLLCFLGGFNQFGTLLFHMLGKVFLHNKKTHQIFITSVYTKVP